MADDPELGDDIGWWNCSLCTYKNSADKFKCEICDLRRGTSTRKPRCNADTIVAQVVKQQEQIRQQTRSKPLTTPKSSRGSTSANNGNQNSIAPTTSSDGQSKLRKTHRTPEGTSLHGGDDDEDDIEEYEDLDSYLDDKEPKVKKRKSSLSKTKKKSRSSSSANARKTSKTSVDASAFDESSTDSDTSNATDKLSNSSGSRIRERSLSASSVTSNYSSSAISSPEPTNSPNHIDHSLNSANTVSKSDELEELPNKITPIEIKGNLIKYAPPTSTGRTGLIIDKKRFTQHSVTVNDVTITFTEFATRQNKYIRKKKKRREHSKPRPHANSNNTNSIENGGATSSGGSNKNRVSVKSEPRPSSATNNSTSHSTPAGTATGDQ